MKFPIILPKEATITRKLILETHIKSGCLGANFTHNTIRERYFIVHGKSTIKATLKHCNICKYMRPMAQTVPVAPLPAKRLEELPCFSFIGMDIGGPIYVADKSPLYKNDNFKRYFLIMSCFSSRMTHLEILLNREAD